LSLDTSTNARKAVPASHPSSQSRWLADGFAGNLALAGFIIYAIFAPHSIAGAEMGLLLVGMGWLLRTVQQRRTGIRRSPLDLPIFLFAAWTILSALLSTEPRISLPKLQSVCVLFLFYLSQAIITRRTAVVLVVLMIVSGAAGALWSVAEIARGRGVRIAEMSADSPFHTLQLGAGDAIWRVNARRISSVTEIDEAIRQTRAGERLSISVIKDGEHAEWPGIIVTDDIKARPSPSGLVGAGRTHRFRASGWTRHYETFSETLQILAQLALGLALANWRERRARRSRVLLALAGFAVLSLGIALTAMRTVLVALAIGALVTAWRGTRSRRTRLFVVAAILIVLVGGALMVWRTRAPSALWLQDQSASLRLRVARVGLASIPQRPLFGHGMDAIKTHWTEWGFPGSEVIHLHSTPLQIAFERGLPALFFWLWIVAQFWLSAARAEKQARHSEDTNLHGLCLGATGSMAGFFASSLVNYNFGDAEVALVFWWLMGIVVSLQFSVLSFQLKPKAEEQQPGAEN
jgi:O-antigen ligase